MRIVIVDYGMGNIKSISSTLQYLEVKEVLLSAEYEVLRNADKIILPGVGSFAKAMSRIRNAKIDLILGELSVKGNTPLLGICLGMQLLGLSSPEDGFNTGLGFVDGIVTKFDSSACKVPHVGFNQVKPNASSRLYKFLPVFPDFYFTHSYKMNTSANIHQSMCEYDQEFVASFEKDNIAGVQFHPELSQGNGLQLLKNFIELF